MADAKITELVDVVLTGCRPEPLASYLKALGVLRLVAQQKDASARGRWRGEHFVLTSRLTRQDLVDFFASEWRPTPVVAPWNGGSGFYPKDNRAAAEAILASADPRLAPFAETIRLARSFVAAQGWQERPADDAKTFLIAAMRALLPESALEWLDAALVLGDDRPLFPPLLGTGGNDGRLDFSNNFQQRVIQVLTSATRVDELESSLFGSLETVEFKGTMGQYAPAANERTNPWDFVLLIEGAMVFAAAATRRYENTGPTGLSFPFHARAAGGVATLADSDEADSRGELWLPLWSAPATYREVRHLFAEGRATVGAGKHARPASTALDFARAVSALGVDRGVEAFVRVGFHVRNGFAYFATPLGRFETRDVPESRLLDDLDSGEWLDRLRRQASAANAPARVAVAKRRLEHALFEAVRTGRLTSVLLELGATDEALAQSLAFAKKALLRPVPRLRAAWAEAVLESSPEQRLGAALASRVGMRARLIPLDESGRGFGQADQAECVFTDRPLVDNLHALLLREEVEALVRTPRPAADPTAARCTLSDIAAFIAGTVDDTSIERWLRAAILVEGGLWPPLPRETVLPPATFAVLALVHGRRLGEASLPRTPTLLSRACAGDAVGATSAAIRRLNAAARPFPVRSLFEAPATTRRIAAALAFPLRTTQRRTLERQVLGEVEEPTPLETMTEPTQEPA